MKRMIEFPKLIHHKNFPVIPGEAPGKITPAPDAEKSRIYAIAFGPEALHEQEITDTGEIEELCKKFPIIWVNVDGLGDTEYIQALGDYFSIDRLALEDIFNLGHRPKVEEYDNCIYFIAKMFNDHLKNNIEQVSLFLGTNFILTFQVSSGDNFERVRDRIRGNRGRIRKSGAEYVYYALIDAIIDSYFSVLDKYDERLEHLQTKIISGTDDDLMPEISKVKIEVRTLGRVMRPMQIAIEYLYSEDIELISDAVTNYLRDCYDHANQLTDQIDSFEAHCTDMMSFYLSAVSNRLNGIMKVLTIVSMIFIPLTFITGWYGMNFEYMPELHWKMAYPAVLLIMVACVVFMIMFFKKKKWL